MTNAKHAKLGARSAPELNGRRTKKKRKKDRSVIDAQIGTRSTPTLHQTESNAALHATRRLRRQVSRAGARGAARDAGP
jgi:hypothetical protein